MADEAVPKSNLIAGMPVGVVVLILLLIIIGVFEYVQSVQLKTLTARFDTAAVYSVPPVPAPEPTVVPTVIEEDKGNQGVGNSEPEQKIKVKADKATEAGVLN